MKSLGIAGCATCLVTALLQPAWAEETARISGDIGLGFVIIDSGDNLTPEGSSSTIKDLTSSAENETFFAPMLIPSLSWDVGAPEGAVLFVNTDPPVDEAGSLGINVGLTDEIEGVGILEAGGFFSPFGEVYENPYLTGVKRQTTSAIEYGAKIALNRILGSGLRLSAAWLTRDVDDDALGRLNPKMARDGEIYSFKANYSFYLSETFEIRPRLGVRSGDFKGEINNYVKARCGLELSYTLGQLTVVPEIYFSRAEYDEENPVFNKTREDDGYGVQLALHYAAPFGYENWSAVALLGYSRDDSNIDFYDTRAVTSGLLLNYAFAY